MQIKQYGKLFVVTGILLDNLSLAKKEAIFYLTQIIKQLNWSTKCVFFYKKLEQNSVSSGYPDCQLLWKKSHDPSTIKFIISYPSRPRILFICNLSCTFLRMYGA